MGAIRRTLDRVLPPAAVNGMILIKDELRGMARGAMLRGNRVECPCCGGRFRRWLPTGTVVNRVAACPRCNARERQRLMLLYLRRKTEFFAHGGRLLHVAPERGLKSLFTRLPNVQYVSVDLGSWLADMTMDLTDLLFRDATFDAVICSHVLEHVPDDRKAMAEIHRVLKPGGWAILMVPLRMDMDATDEEPTINDPAEQLRRFGQEDHVRQYGRDYLDRLRAARFDVRAEDYGADLGAEARARHGLREGELVIFCTKAG